VGPIFFVRAPSGEVARFFSIFIFFVSAGAFAEGALVRVISDALAGQQWY
jgi:hypothetical protein